jgi:hypothetical protein
MLRCPRHYHLRDKGEKVRGGIEAEILLTIAGSQLLQMVVLCVK